MRLLDCRRRLGISRQELAARAACSATSLLGFEKYGLEPSDPLLRARIAAALGVAEVDLWDPLPADKRRNWRARRRTG